MTALPFAKEAKDVESETVGRGLTKESRYVSRRMGRGNESGKGGGRGKDIVALLKIWGWMLWRWRGGKASGYVTVGDV